jgi:glutathione peroxidase-family protein
MKPYKIAKGRKERKKERLKEWKENVLLIRNISSV